MECSKRDLWGYEVHTASDDCIAAINAFYHQVLSFGRGRSVILQAPEHDPECVLGNALAAHFLASSDPPRAPPYFDAARSRLEEATEYEKAVFESVSYLASEDEDDDVAVELHSKLLDEFPNDLFSLKRAQLLCFYMGEPELSLNLVQKVLPVHEDGNYIYGMLAFALLEHGRMKEAAEAARKGFEINKRDFWSQHALCHVLQYECRFKEAVEFMVECSTTWTSCSSFMYTHNWWHIALCYLEGGAPVDQVLRIYDEHIWKELEKPDASPPEVYLGALGLLLRVYVHGEIYILQDRLQILADRVRDRSVWFIEWHLDLLILWALAVTKESSGAEELLEGLRSKVSRMIEKKQRVMQGALKLAEALYEFGKGNEELSLEPLGSGFDAVHYKFIGASDEQLDVFNEVYYVMLLRAGKAEEATDVLEKRVKEREGLPFLWRLLALGYAMAGRSEAAKAAGETSRALEIAHFS
uniref:Tetratricopeptide repeat protein 38 n=1 Tax=Kalanchoe fedtschenkoi TaxID=63787 RepID=A0A7N0TSG5_KALFE